MERFEIVKKLGRGSYGSAVAAMRKDTKELVVIKRVDMTEMDEAEKKQVGLWAVAEQFLPQVQPRDALGQWPAGRPRPRPPPPAPRMCACVCG